MDDSGFNRNDRNAWLIVASAFVVLVVAKAVFVAAETYGPTILSDELLYIKYARSFAENGHYKGSGYPLLYPLLLSACIKLGAGFYDAIKMMNVVLSSLVVFPTYLLARLALPRSASLLCVAIAAVLPYHLVFPRQIMSENVFFPLLLYTLYLCVRVPRKGSELAWDALLGVCIGLLFLTRYMAAALLPAFALAWLVTNWQPGWKPWLRGLAIIAIVAVVVSPWFAMGLSHGLRLKFLLGLGIADDPDPGQRTLWRLGAWTWLYASYYILMAATFLHFMLLAIPDIAKGIRRDGLFRYRVQVAVLLVVAFTGLAAVRHSWNAFYNFPDFSRIMGRYLVFFPPLFAVFALAALQEVKGKVSFRRIACSQAVSLLLVALAFATLVLGDVIPLGSRFITDRGSVDAYAIQLAGWAWPLLVAATVVASGLLLRNRPEWAAPAAVLGALLAVAIAFPAYDRKLRSYSPQTIPAAELHRRGIRDDFVVYTQHLKPIERRDPGPAIKASYPFWLIEGHQTRSLKNRFPAGYRHFIVGPTTDLAAYEAIDTLKVFRSRGEEYRLIEIAR